MMPMLFVIFLDMFKLCSFQFRFESMKMDRWMDRCMHNRHVDVPCTLQMEGWKAFTSGVTHALW